MLRRLNNTRNRGDVDDCSGIAILVLRGLLKEGQESHGHEEKLGNIGAVGVNPVCVGLPCQQYFLWANRFNNLND